MCLGGSLKMWKPTSRTRGFIRRILTLFLKQTVSSHVSNHDNLNID